MKSAVAAVVVMSFAAVVCAEQSAPVDYRFEQVKRSVTVTESSRQPHAVEKGEHAQSGDKVTTGWFSYALIASDRHKAKFEIFSSTDVLLASGTPGVILSVERGRLRAVFDKITGNEPRVVETPGALLAVRGTQYDVEVDSAGRTTLDVWEGTVEVKSALLEQPLLVHAGEESSFGRREAPMARPIPDDRRKNAPPPREGDRTGTRSGGPHETGPHVTPREPGLEGHDHPEPQPGQQPPAPPHGSGHSSKPPESK